MMTFTKLKNGEPTGKPITYTLAGRSANSYSQEVAAGTHKHLGTGRVVDNNCNPERRDPNLTHFFGRV